MTNKTTKPARRFARPSSSIAEARGLPVTKHEEARQSTASSDVPSRQTKQALVLALLRSERGASLAEMVEATSWQPHTTRAALTGLRKKGHAITKDKVDGVTRYSIAQVAAS